MTLVGEGDTLAARLVHAFPVYTRAEQRADFAIHVIGLLGAVALIPVLISRVPADATARTVASVAIYLFGLLAMLSASAAYNLTRPSRLKRRLRTVDRSMIYVMIAGTYTPIALDALPPASGNELLVLVWACALIGIALELTPGSRLHYNLSLLLYFAMGWCCLFFARSFIAALPAGTVALIVAGGVVYMVGAIIHARGTLPFHNPIWHALVAAAATLHFIAVTELLPT